MTTTSTHPDGAAPPWEGLREKLLERSRIMASSGDDTGAAVLHALVESWWHEQQAWDEDLRQALMVNHEINNALVGVSGNVQLLLMSQVGLQPGFRERLEVILREAARVERASRGLGETKARLGLAPGPASNQEVAHGGHATHAG